MSVLSYEEALKFRNNYDFKNYKQEHYFRKHNLSVDKIKHINYSFDGTMKNIDSRKKICNAKNCFRAVLWLSKYYLQDETIIFSTTNPIFAAFYGTNITPMAVSRLIKKLEDYNIIRCVDDTYWFSTANGEKNKGKSRYFNFNRRAAMYFLKLYTSKLWFVEEDKSIIRDAMSFLLDEKQISSEYYHNWSISFVFTVNNNEVVSKKVYRRKRLLNGSYRIRHDDVSWEILGRKPEGSKW